MRIFLLLLLNCGNRIYFNGLEVEADSFLSNRLQLVKAFADAYKIQRSRYDVNLKSDNLSSLDLLLAFACPKDYCFLNVEFDCYGNIFHNPFERHTWRTVWEVLDYFGIKYTLNPPHLGLAATPCTYKNEEFELYISSLLRPKQGEYRLNLCPKFLEDEMYKALDILKTDYPSYYQIIQGFDLYISANFFQLDPDIRYKEAVLQSIINAICKDKYISDKELQAKYIKLGTKLQKPFFLTKIMVAALVIRIFWLAVSRL